jgi:mono/diheme cytochrome c family protein
MGAGAAMAVALLLPRVSAVAAPATTAHSPLPALFTARDAAQGKIVFAQHCAACHGADLRGKIGPAVIGPVLGSAANHTTVSIMFNVIAAEMPEGDPASLTNADYAAVMAYLLQQNGYPAGTRPLTFSAAETSDVPLISQVR